MIPPARKALSLPAFTEGAADHYTGHSEAYRQGRRSSRKDGSTATMLPSFVACLQGQAAGGGRSPFGFGGALVRRGRCLLANKKCYVSYLTQHIRFNLSSNKTGKYCFLLF